MVDEHGPENVVLIFADTLIESKGLYVRNEEVSKYLGIPIIRISKELTPWQLFRREGLIGNDHFPICSTKLKREPLNEWMESHYEMDENQHNYLYEPATVILGFDYSEYHRVVDFHNQHPNWRVRAPMTEGPLWDKCKMESEARKLGFTISEAYEQGYPHDNCVKRCVKAGISHWVHLHNTDLPAFMEWENEEVATQKDFRLRGISNWQFTILKDRRGGETKPLLLRDLRIRIESGEQFPKYAWGGCGCH
jgi:hypothetical protein